MIKIVKYAYPRDQNEVIFNGKEILAVLSFKRKQYLYILLQKL